MADLYRHFGPSGELLYVGISLSAAARTQQHKGSASWFELIRNITIEKFETREEALAAERDAIVKEKPLHNIQHNVGGERVKPLAVGLIELEGKFDASAALNSMREFAYNPVIVKRSSDLSEVLYGRADPPNLAWRVKWRNYLGEACDQLCATEEEAEAYARKIKSFRCQKIENEERLRFWSQYGGQ